MSLCPLPSAQHPYSSLTLKNSSSMSLSSVYLLTLFNPSLKKIVLKGQKVCVLFLFARIYFVRFVNLVITVCRQFHIVNCSWTFQFQAYDSNKILSFEYRDATLRAVVQSSHKDQSYQLSVCSTQVIAVTVNLN